MADTGDVGPDLLDYEEEGDEDMLDATRHQEKVDEMDTDYDNNRKVTRS